MFFEPFKELISVFSPPVKELGILVGIQSKKENPERKTEKKKVKKIKKTDG